MQDPYESFLLVTRVWVYITSFKRSGQAHGIDIHFPYRPPGNLSVYCPTCPEPDVNMELGWDDAPHWLRYSSFVSLQSNQ